MKRVGHKSNYNMIIVHRGHAGKHDVDIVIKKGSAFVEKIG